MTHPHIEAGLNKQIGLEGFASMYYLSMASWCESKGLRGMAAFLYRQSDEERMHMLKLFHYINDREGLAIVPAMEAPPVAFDSLQAVLEAILAHEKKVSAEINQLAAACMEARDYTTLQFLQWYVNEQIEEESMARQLLDTWKLLGNDQNNQYIFDRDLMLASKTPSAK